MCLVHLESIKYETIYNHKPQTHLLSENYCHANYSYCDIAIFQYIHLLFHMSHTHALYEK